DESYDTDIWVIGADGSGLTKISDRKTEDTSPRWSPDGQTIAFLNTIGDTANRRIYLAPSSGGAPPRLAADGLDLIPAGLRWAEGGRALYFETGFKGTSQIYRVDVAAKRFAPITSGNRTFHLFSINDRTTRIAYAINDPTHLDDLYVADLNGR